jgi:predicted RNase H-like HicB family nuclease
MDFHTVVLRKSADYWVALCLENGLVGQGNTQESAIAHLQDAIESLEMVEKSVEDIYQGPISVKDLHEFLTVASAEPISEVFELRAVYA